MAAGIWRPQAGAVEVVSKGRHNFQAIGFWAYPPEAAVAAADEDDEDDDEDDEGEGDDATAATAAARNPRSHSTRRLYLHIEDAVAWVDSGDLMLFAEEQVEEEEAEQTDSKRRQRRPRAAPRLRLLSLQEAVRLSAGPSCHVSGARLVLRAHLSRLGYVVGRFPARWSLRAGEAPGAPWRGAAGGGWAACDGRAGEDEAAAEEEGVVARAQGAPDAKRRRRAEPAQALQQRGWWLAVGDARHPWLSSGGNGQAPPSELPTSLAAPNWRYEAWLHAWSLAAGHPPPALPLPARDVSPLPHPGASLRARFPLLRALPVLSDEELGLPPAAAPSSSHFSPSPPPLLPVLYDVHAASGSFRARDPGRPAFRAGLAPEGEAAAGWALPPLRDVAASEQASVAAAAVSASEGGAATRPVPVRWAAVLAGGDVAFFSVETARLLDAIGTGAAEEAGGGGG